MTTADPIVWYIVLLGLGLLFLLAVVEAVADAFMGVLRATATAPRTSLSPSRCCTCGCSAAATTKTRGNAGAVSVMSVRDTAERFRAMDCPSRWTTNLPRGGFV